MLDSCKMVEKRPKAFHMFLWHFFPSLKQSFIAYSSSKVSDCIFEIHQLWQSCFCWVYSNSFCGCSFEPEIIKISQSSRKMYSNNILNFQNFTTILNAHRKKVRKLIVCTSYCYLTLVILFNINGFKSYKWFNISIWSIDGILTGHTALGVSGPGSNSSKGVLPMPQSSRTKVSLSDGLVSYTGYCTKKSWWLMTVYVIREMT